MGDGKGAEGKKTPKKSSLAKCEVKVDGAPSMLVQFRHATVLPQVANTQLRFSAKRTFEASQHTCPSTDISVESNTISFKSKPTTTKARYAIGIRRKGQSTLTLIPADLFDLHPSPKNQVVGQEDVSLDSAEARINARNDLVESFGGKRQKKVLNARKRNKLSDDSLEGTAKVIESSLEKFDKAGLQTNNFGLNEGRLLPPHNADAEFLGGVFPLAELVLQSERSALKSKCFVDFNSVSEESVENWRSENKYMPCIINALEECIELEKGPLRSSKILASKYSVLLMMFLHHASSTRNISRERLRKSCKSIPKPIFEKFVREFLGGANVDEDDTLYSLSKRGKDLLLMYIIVTTCNATNYIVPVEELVAELKVPKTHLIKLTRTLHCGTKTINKKAHLTIKLWKNQN